MKQIKLDRDSRQYNQEVMQLLMSYGPRVYPCAKCGHPVLDGYCCTYCGTSNPQEPDED